MKHGKTNFVLSSSAEIVKFAFGFQVCASSVLFFFMLTEGSGERLWVSFLLSDYFYVMVLVIPEVCEHFELIKC